MEWQKAHLFLLFCFDVLCIVGKARLPLGALRFLPGLVFTFLHFFVFFHKLRNQFRAVKVLLGFPSIVLPDTSWGKKGATTGVGNNKQKKR